MIRELHINNYKSLNDLTLEVGRFNVFIGENGCGKSNLLEAIALAAAAAADKLDHEFLDSRGIRATDPQLMRSAFNEENLQKPIKIGVGYKNLDELEKYTLINDNQPYANWIRLEDTLLSGLAKVWINVSEAHDVIKTLQSIDIENYGSLLKEMPNVEKEFLDDFTAKLFGGNKEGAKKYLSHYENIKHIEEELKSFIIYSPENTALRNFYKEGQIEPLGINGEGLLKLLKVIQSKSSEQRQEIHASLQLFDWYAELRV